MKKNIFKILILFFLLLSYNKILAEECDIEKKWKDYCNIYYNNVENECNAIIEKYTPIYKIPDDRAYKTPEEFKKDPDFWIWLTSKKEMFPFEMAKRNYRENQNNIYKCWLLASQSKSYNLIKQLIKIDKTWAIKNNLETKIDAKIKQIDALKKDNCEKELDLSPSKKQVLDQATYEMCKYIYYLEFLKVYYNDIKNVIWTDQEWIDAFSWANIDASYIVNRKEVIMKDIENEVNHTYELYPIAFNAYSEYESFLPIHIALDLVKEDFIIYREKLYRVISPINQVVYKIINAMSK